MISPYALSGTLRVVFQSVVLRDVAKGTDNIMNRDFYFRSVGHRQALFPEKVQAIRKAINICMMSHNKIKILPQAEEELEKVQDCTDSLLKAQIRIVKDFVDSFLRLHRQVL